MTYKDLPSIRELPMSPPLDFWIPYFTVLYFEEIVHFFNQGADIELNAILVNKKAAFDDVNDLNKFKITKSPLSCGR
jgi:hypothetical protein